MDLYSKDELLTHQSGGRHDDVEPSGDDLPSGRVPGRAPEPSRSRVDGERGDGTFHGILIGCLGFSIKEVFMGERATSGGPVGPTPCPRAAKRRGPPPCGVGASWPSSVSPLDSVYVTVK